METVLGYVLVAVLYLAGSLAASDAGWVATAQFLKLEPGLGRSALIAAAEAFVGMGTGLLAVVVGLWLQPERVFTFVLAAAIGVAMGLYRQLKALGDETARQAGHFEATEDPRAARSETVGRLLLREVRFGGASRVIGVGAVLVAVLVEALR